MQSFIGLFLSNTVQCLAHASNLDSGISHLCSLLSLFKFLLGLAEFGKVKSSNLLSLINLLLVGLDLSLQLVGQVGHSVLVLLLILRELELLDLALSSLVSLHGLRGASLHRSKLSLELTDSHFKLGHGSLSSSHGS